ncbi:MAG: response regulator [Rhodoferax sp.]|nr:response regulator [Pseudorhodobacter sp.]
MGQHVLLIEDEPNIAEAIRFVLARDGWQVSVLADGALAVAEVSRLRPDLVILDLMLPGKSGLEIVAQLRAAPGTQSLPVMMLTAKGLARDRDAALAAGVSVFITKPFANADIVAQARAMVGL